MEESPPCAEGRALFAAKLAYLEARIAPEPSQEGAWRTFASAMRASAGELDRACAEDPPRSFSVDAGERLERMEKHAAAMQAMFGAMAKAYVAIAPNLTAAQRDILSRNIVPSAPFPDRFPRRLPGLASASPRRLALNCGPGEPGLRGWASLRTPAALISKLPPHFVRLREHVVTTFAFGNDVRRRAVIFGGLALLAVSVFIVGAWAGVVRIWPVRYSLQLIDGVPKPFVSAPESRPLRPTPRDASWAMPARSRSNARNRPEEPR